jgi:REP element-mobilizing transposase RayT
MENIFGDIMGDAMILNEFGKIVDFCWHDLVNHYRNIRLDEYCIMPNHFHGIVIISGNDNCIGIVGNGPIVGNGFKPFPTGTLPTGLSEIIRGFKTFSSRRIHETANNPKFRWQKSFHDHIIRTDEELYYIRKYIKNNPANWNKDKDESELSNERTGSNG